MIIHFALRDSDFHCTRDCTHRIIYMSFFKHLFIVMNLSLQWFTNYTVRWSLMSARLSEIPFLLQLQCNSTSEIISASKTALSHRNLCRVTTWLWKTCCNMKLFLAFQAVQSCSEYVFLFVLPNECAAPSVCIISDILFVGTWESCLYICT